MEELVIAAIYAGLIEATLDPKRQAVQVTSIAPLRDLSPGAVPEMISILDRWSDRCTSTLEDLEAQILSIRTAAMEREIETAAAEKKMQDAIEELKESSETKKHEGHTTGLTRRGFMKRAVGGPGHSQDAESMELDEPAYIDDRRSSKRKM